MFIAFATLHSNLLNLRYSIKLKLSSRNNSFKSGNTIICVRLTEVALNFDLSSDKSGKQYLFKNLEIVRLLTQEGIGVSSSRKLIP